MVNAFLWGLLATSSLLIGGFIALRFKLSKKVIGIIMAFGAGTLISAVSYELIFESVKLAQGSGFPAFGFFAGAFTYFISDWAIEKFSGRNQSQELNAGHSKLIIPMVLAIILDGIPESIVIGLGLFETGNIGIAMLVAVFISNLPEAIAGTSGMKASGWSKAKVFKLWFFIVFICAISTVCGFALFRTASNEWLSFIQAFAGGAILMMLANSMMPEAFEKGGKRAGVFTVLGFFVSISIIILENKH